MKKTLILTLITLAAIYIVICILLYFNQEKIIFHPQPLAQTYPFSFNQPFEEKSIKTTDGETINGLLFKAEHPKGLIFYLHGNAGSLSTWGNVADTYTKLNYDVFIYDYRSYGKSTGIINNKQQLFDDAQTVYDQLKKLYPENKIVILGYSIGTGMAAKLASNNNARLLILQAPYFSIADMMRHILPIIPTFILKYNFETNQYLKQCKMPAVIFHGDADEVIYYNSSVKLKQGFKPTDTLITLKKQGHNGITDNPDYKAAIAEVLK